MVLQSLSKADQGERFWSLIGPVAAGPWKLNEEDMIFGDNNELETQFQTFFLLKYNVRVVFLIWV